MTLLNDHQKQLLFDYCIGLTSDNQSAEAQELIASSDQAAEIHAKLKCALAPLDCVVPESCPDELVEGTIWRLNNVARSGQLHLQQLLADEQTRTVGSGTRFWRNFGRIGAVAAVILFAAAVWHPALSFARQKYWQQRCGRQLSGIFHGLRSYMSDYDRKVPAVAAKAGEPWWKVGYQGKENYSTTRNMWLLVKNGYVKSSYFMCPGKRQRSTTRVAAEQIGNLNDFPGRNHVTYSIRIRCPKSAKPFLRGRNVLMADLSPLFENLPQDFTKPLKIKLSAELLTLNSINHNRRGQNVLFCDGSVTFISKRHIGVATDDIFTLREMSDGSEVQGHEMPSCETDAFLAP
jgi:prepilin-type processing-associated H-X9-DG protein